MSSTMRLTSRNLFQLLESTKQQLCRQTYQKYSTAPPVNSDTFISRNFDEITIPVPWGHLAGKWYGPKHVRPLLGLHGWEDNAGTFDKLAPLLPPDIGFLCLDMPGHGLSSWLPAGIAYHAIDYVALLLRIMQDFNWENLSLLGHSMGSINSFMLSALFPDKIDMLIGLDVLKPVIRIPKMIVDNYGERLLNLAAVERRLSDKMEPPCYEWDQLVERMYLGSEKSVERENCKHLLQRNVKPSSHSPNKYYFSRDSRLKSSLYFAMPREIPLEMITRIKCPHLFIKATGAPFYESKEYYDEALEMLKKTNPLFEYHEVSGTHHVHLNEPEKISRIINPFINQWFARASRSNE